ncbi:MAG TPA: ferredoxin [Mycobacteriales bacterium]|jgi:ferredoxin|nr:ferredoxin [Mycobacteriales bacterium]
MKVNVDQSKCQGHAQCNANAPEVYQLDDDGYIAFDGDIDIAPGNEDAARRGAAACPERVLTVIE